MKTRLVRLALLAMFALAVACGDDDGGDGGGGGAIDAPTIDAPASAIDAATADGATQGTMCGARPCTTSEECCVSGSDIMCVPTDSCTGITFECDGPEDCTTAGEVCCYGAGQTGGTSCVPSADCDAPACRTMMDCPDQNQQCCMVGQFGVCARNCPGGP